MVIRALLLFLALTLPAAAGPENGKQEELKDLRGRIEALRQEMEQASEDRAEAADGLKNSERRISDVARSLRALEAKQRRLARELRQLEAETDTVNREISDQQRRLTVLLRERYMQGGNEPMKLLLNGQNPGEVARNLEYYGYIGRARADIIREYQDSLAHLGALKVMAATVAPVGSGASAGGTVTFHPLFCNDINTLFTSSARGAATVKRKVPSAL